MFELIIQNVKSRSGVFTLSYISSYLSRPRPFTIPPHPNHPQHLTAPAILLKVNLHRSHYPVNHVPSSGITRPRSGLLGPRLSRSSTDRNFIPPRANLNLRPRNSHFRTHPLRQSSPAPMRQPTMFIWSRSSRDLTSISGHQYHPLHDLSPLLHYHLRH